MLRRTFLKGCAAFVSGCAFAIGFARAKIKPVAEAPAPLAIRTPLSPDDGMGPELDPYTLMCVPGFKRVKWTGETPFMDAAFRALDSMPCAHCGEPLNTHANFTDELPPAVSDWFTNGRSKG